MLASRVSRVMLGGLGVAGPSGIRAAVSMVAGRAAFSLSAPSCRKGGYFTPRLSTELGGNSNSLGCLAGGRGMCSASAEGGQPPKATATATATATAEGAAPSPRAGGYSYKRGSWDIPQQQRGGGGRFSADRGGDWQRDWRGQGGYGAQSQRNPSDDWWTDNKGVDIRSTTKAWENARNPEMVEAELAFHKSKGLGVFGVDKIGVDMAMKKLSKMVTSEGIVAKFRAQQRHTKPCQARRKQEDLSQWRRWKGGMKRLMRAAVNARERGM